MYKRQGYGGHGDPGLGVEDVVPDNVTSGGPPFDMGLTMSAPTKKNVSIIIPTHAKSVNSSQPLYTLLLHELLKMLNTFNLAAIRTNRRRKLQFQRITLLIFVDFFSVN